MIPPKVLAGRVFWGFCLFLSLVPLCYSKSECDVPWPLQVFKAMLAAAGEAPGEYTATGCSFGHSRQRLKHKHPEKGSFHYTVIPSLGNYHLKKNRKCFTPE